MSGEGHSNNRTARAKLGLVTHDNTGGYYVVECQGCGSVYPSLQCHGGEAIADTGDYSDATCPHCHQADPDECGNVGLAWNTQQEKINELQQRLTTADQRIDELEGQLAGGVVVSREWLNAVTLMQMSHEELQDQALEYLCEPCDDAALSASAEPAKS